MTVLTGLFCGAEDPAFAQSRVPWTTLSSTSGNLPPPNGGTEQTSCVVADVDHNGATDFFITDRTVAPSVILYRRQGTGWQKCIVESTQMAIEAGGDAADIDGDGDLDVAFGQDFSGGNVWWWENPGAQLNPSTPWTRRVIKTGGGQQHDQRFGDFDGDGRLEFATWVNGSGVVEIYEIPTDRNTTPWQRAAVISASGEGMDVADVDLDGKVDLLIGGHWIKHGGGTTYTKNVIDGGYTTTRIIAGQFIPGGRPEVLQNSGDATGPLAFYRFDGSTWQKTILISQVNHGHSLEVGDFDRDGHLDFFAAEMGNPGAGANCKAWIGFGNSAGQFTIETIRTGLCNHMSRVADVDGDGDLDIVMKPYKQGAPRVDVFLNSRVNTTTSLDSWTRRVIDGQRPWRAIFITSADLNRDGLPDVVTGAWWYRNPGSTTGTWTRNTIGSPLNNYAVVYDFDGDGSLDILGTQGQGSASDARFVWARNNGSGGFTIFNNVASGEGTFLQGAAAAVFRSGNPTEVALSFNSTGTGLQMLTVPANPTTGTWSMRTLSQVSQTQQLTEGDLDRDGDLDLLLGTKWLRNDSGTWNLQTLNPSGGLPDRNRLVDINRDGRLDSVVGFEVVSGTAKLVWYEQPASASTTWTEHLIANLIGPMSLDVADIDRDGDLDIVVGEHNLSNPSSARLFIYENRDGVGGSWLSHLVYTGDEHHDGAQLVDVDRDGDLDIISIGWGHSQVLLYENTGGSGPPPPPPPTSQVATPTITPDGGAFSESVSVSLQTPTSGSTIRYTMDGSVPTSASPVYSGAFQVTSSATIRAVASKSGMSDSGVASAVFAVGSPPPAVVPTGELALWLRADAGVNVSGSSVTEWQDQSGNGVHASQSTAVSRPTLVANALNGKPIIQFDGVDDFLTFTLSPNGLTAATLCLVSANTSARTGGSSKAGDAALFWNETQSWGTLCLSPFQAMVQFRFGTTQPNNWPTFTRPTSIGAAYSMTIAVKKGSTDALYVNGLPVLAEGGKLASISGCQTTGNVGRGYNNNTYFPGGIAEVLVYRRALTESERQGLEAHLQAKYFGSTSSQVAAPTITPNGGSFSGPVSVTLQTATAGATIRYTLDGSIPDAGSTPYSGAFQVSSSATVRAYASKSGMSDSAEASAAFTIGTPPPAEIPTTDLALWLRADTGVTVAGSAVTQWQDQSGNGVHAGQTTAASRPVLVAAALNGKPAIQFDGVDDFLTFTLSPNGLSGMTLCLVSANTSARTGGSSEAGDAALFWNETQSWSTVGLSPFQALVQFRFGTGQINNSPTYVRPASIGSAYSMTIAVKNGTTDSLYVNGVQVVSESGKLAAIAGTQSTGNLGRGYNNNTFFPGAIAEVLVYRRALTDSERQELEGHLQAKYFAAQVATPTISPNGGSFGDTVTVTLQSATAGATIRYTLDGSVPGPGSEVYAGPVELTNSTTVRAYASASGLSDSAVASAVFIADSSGPPNADLALWLRADAGVTANGSSVAQWKDQSGNGVHASQSTAASQPVLVANALNGKPALQFDGVNDFLTFTLPINGLTGMTLCLVSANTAARDGGSTEGGDAALFWNESQSWGTVYLSPFQAVVQLRFGTTQSYNWPTYTRPSSAGSAYSLTIAVKNSSSDSLYVNGTLVLAENGKLATIAGCQNTGNLGRGYNNNTYFPGAIAEVLVYQRALSQSERQSLEGYLQSKYFASAAFAPLPNAVPVVARPSLGIERRGNGLILGEVRGDANQAYEVLISGDLTSWDPLLTQVSAADGTFEFAVTNSSPKSLQFFRVRTVPSTEN